VIGKPEVPPANWRCAAEFSEKGGPRVVIKDIVGLLKREALTATKFPTVPSWNGITISELHEWKGFYFGDCQVTS
jgi:hypothetical protein